MHTGKPTSVAVSHCITWFQTQLILTTCQIRYHSHLWDHLLLTNWFSELQLHIKNANHQLHAAPVQGGCILICGSEVAGTNLFCHSDLSLPG